MSPLKPGQVAPDFDLPSATGSEKGRFKLSEQRGTKNVVLSFHVLNWTPVWTAQVAAFQSALDRFAALDAQVVGISSDSVFSHVAWQKHEVGTLGFPLCSDFWPHGDVARKYGVFREQEPYAGISERAVFVVDKEGKIIYTRVYRLDQVPEVDECVRALEGVSAGR